MGIFDFVRGAGARVFGRDGPREGAPEIHKPLRQHVEEHGIDASALKFRFEDGVLIVEGRVPDADTREKVILIVGNVEGVDKVDDRLQVGSARGGGGGAPAVAVAPATKQPLAGAFGTAAAGDAQKMSGEAARAADDRWQSKTYTVKSGDTLSAIAKAHYGDANRWPRIFEANQPMLKDPDRIYPGQVLRIPAD